MTWVRWVHKVLQEMTARKVPKAKLAQWVLKDSKAKSAQWVRRDCKAMLVPQVRSGRKDRRAFKVILDLKAPLV